MVGDDRVNNETAAASLAKIIQVAQSVCADRSGSVLTGLPVGNLRLIGNKPLIPITFPDVIMGDY